MNKKCTFENELGRSVGKGQQCLDECSVLIRTVHTFSECVCVCGRIFLFSVKANLEKILPVVPILSCKTNPLSLSHPPATGNHNWVSGSSCQGWR